jgi:prevent-host-death family protein
MTERLGVARAKREFSDLLGAVRHRGARFIIERRGTPMAALVPVEELEGEPRGFLGLVGAFDDAPELADALEEIVQERSGEQTRSAPEMPA